jgi:hypothetical protein
VAVSGRAEGEREPRPIGRDTWLLETRP